MLLYDSLRFLKYYAIINLPFYFGWSLTLAMYRDRTDTLSTWIEGKDSDIESDRLMGENWRLGDSRGGGGRGGIS